MGAVLIKRHLFSSREAWGKKAGTGSALELPGFRQQDLARYVRYTAHCSRLQPELTLAVKLLGDRIQR